MLRLWHAKKSTLTSKIIIALISGFITGLVLNFAQGYSEGFDSFLETWVIEGTLAVIGKLFISAIVMLVVPLVFISIVGGAAAIGDVRKLGRIGGKTIAFYLTTTAVAITIALVIGRLANPGEGLDLAHEMVEFSVKKAPPITELFTNIIPRNPVKAMAEGNMLQVIFFALLVGITMAALGKKVEHIHILFEESNHIITKMVTIVMHAAPLGVFCLIGKVFAEQGFTAFLPLLKYMITLLFALFVHLTLVYCGALKIIGRLDPIVFFKKFYPVMTLAFSTASSAATLPVTMRTAEKKLGAGSNITSFTLPFGATVNMDGTAIMQGMAVIFIAQVYGVTLGLTGYLTVILTATMASIGTAAVPSVGLVTLSMVLTQVHLPVEGIAFIMGVDRLLDMARTAVNVTGDTVVTLLVAKSEGELNEACFYDPSAGEDDD